MNLITDTWRQLVRRKLWPVALLLLGALIAVPTVLAKKPQTAPPIAAKANQSEGMPTTFVSAVEETEETKRRRVLGEKKDPFEPAPLKKSNKKKQEHATDESPDKTKADEPAGKAGEKPAGGSTDAPKPGTAPPASPAPPPTATVPQYSIKVRFGEVAETENLTTKTVERLSVLPDEEAPVLVYRGVEDGGKVAVFELTGAVDAQGDGKCEPTPEDCQYLKLRVGETEFITVTETGEETDAQYQLDLVKIYKKATKVSKESLESEAEPLAKGSSLRLDGGVKLRKRNRYVFDKATGTLHRARSKASRASL